jgi:hypothetical protein
MSLRVCLAVSSDHPFAQRKGVSLSEAARQPFVGLLHEEYPQHRVYVNAIFAPVKDKPRVISRKGRLSPAAEKFCECAREAFKAAR